jgi:hypothetical protein
MLTCWRTYPEIRLTLQRDGYPRLVFLNSLIWECGLSTVEVAGRNCVPLAAVRYP